MRVVADELGFTEGPVVLPDGSYAIVGLARILRITPGGEVSTLTEDVDGPNGLAVASDGSILIADNGRVWEPDRTTRGSIRRLEAGSGTATVLHADLDAPNDLCLDTDGSLVFTDPRQSWFAEDTVPGRVYRVVSSGLELLHEGLRYPNGIGVHPDGRLMVAESRTRRLVVLHDGRAEPWGGTLEGTPDGFAFDAGGRGFICLFDSGFVQVMESDGRQGDRIPTGPGSWPTNCTITPDGSLLVTDAQGGKLLSFDLGLEPCGT